MTGGISQRRGANTARKAPPGVLRHAPARRNIPKRRLRAGRRRSPNESAPFRALSRAGSATV
ncbi:hypothetical protein B5F39_08075 [Cloacibacillus sp. An23]|nr:hypothetical protein B5F39_08075 [Cloacibacillus sp. An23]